MKEPAEKIKEFVNIRLIEVSPLFKDKDDYEDTLYNILYECHKYNEKHNGLSNKVVYRYMWKYLKPLTYEDIMNATRTYRLHKMLTDKEWWESV